MRFDLENGLFHAANVPLRIVIAEAWTITPDAVIGPSWLDDVRIEIVAKAASPQTSDADLRLMVRSLLAERMKLITHTEIHEREVLALTVLKGKAKLTPSEFALPPEQGGCLPDRSFGLPPNARCEHITMAQFAYDLPKLAPRYLDRRVIDQTQLGGAWDFDLQWGWVPQFESNEISLFAALQALGLELKPAKLPVPVLVIDSMERAPTPN